MSEASLKSRMFVSEPIGWKSVNEISGIGTVLKERFKKHGILYAKQILGHFLVFRKDKEKFMTWMRDMVRANSRQCRECYECLSEWCDQFL